MSSKLFASAVEAKLHTSDAPDMISVGGYSLPGDGGAARYSKVATEPSHVGKLALKVGGADVWYEIDKTVRNNVRALGGLSSGMTFAAQTGAPILIEGEHALAERINVGQSAQLDVHCEPGSRIVCTVAIASHLPQMIFIEANGNDVSWTGQVWFDCDKRANVGLEIRNSSTANLPKRPNIYLEGIRITGAYFRVPGSFVNAAGLMIAGAWDVLRLVRISAENISRSAGNVAGRSSAGIHYARLLDPLRNARDIRVEDCNAENITTEDSLDSPFCVDCDGLIIFQEDEVAAQCVVEGFRSRNAMGRAIKLAARDAVVNSPVIYRDVPCIRQGSREIAFQYSTGAVNNAIITYAGGDIHNTEAGWGSVAVTFYGSVATDRAQLRMVNNLRIVDQSSGQQTLKHAVDFSIGFAASKHHLSVVNGLHVGPKPIVNLVAAHGYGDAPASFSINDVVANVTGALVESNGPGRKVEGRLANVRNIGATKVPVFKRFDSTSMSDIWGRWVDAGGNKGVAQNAGGKIPAVDKTGIAALAGRFVEGTDENWFSGLSTLCHQTLQPGQLIETDVFGRVAGSGLIAIQTDFGFGVYHAKGNTLTLIAGAEPEVAVSSSGSEPGATGVYRVWKSSGGARLSVRNSTSVARTVAVHVIS